MKALTKPHKFEDKCTLKFLVIFLAATKQRTTKFLPFPNSTWVKC